MKQARKVPVAATPVPLDPREATRQYMQRWMVVGPLLEGIEFWQERYSTNEARQDLGDDFEFRSLWHS